MVLLSSSENLLPHTDVRTGRVPKFARFKMISLRKSYSFGVVGS